MVRGLIISLLLFAGMAHGQILTGILDPAPTLAPPTVTYVQDCGNNAVSGGSITCSLTGVTAGDAILACVTWNPPGTSVLSAISDGTSNFTLGTVTSGAAILGQCGWLLSANGGNKTYSAAFTPGVTAPVIFVAQFHTPAGSWHADTGNQNNGTGTAATTGNISTAQGTSEAILFANSLANTAATASSPTIGGNVPTELTHSPQNTFQHAYYLLNTKITAGQGTLTYSTPTTWAAMLVAIYAQ